jgi:very-short-patch-repair endonuclease
MVDYLPLAQHKNEQPDYRRAKSLRRSSSFAERLIWNDLRRLPKESGLKFRRQHPIHPYIVDFVCLNAKLVIEIDGASHEARQDYDCERSRHLQAMGYDVLRFTNEDVYRNRDAVVETILHKAKELCVDSYVPLP